MQHPIAELKEQKDQICCMSSMITKIEHKTLYFSCARVCVQFLPMQEHQLNS